MDQNQPELPQRDGAEQGRQQEHLGGQQERQLGERIGRPQGEQQGQERQQEAHLAPQVRPRIVQPQYIRAPPLFKRNQDFPLYLRS